MPKGSSIVEKYFAVEFNKGSRKKSAVQFECDDQQHTSTTNQTNTFKLVLSFIFRKQYEKLISPHPATNGILDSEWPMEIHGGICKFSSNRSKINEHTVLSLNYPPYYYVRFRKPSAFLNLIIIALLASYVRVQIFG
uniref:Uncharacterized protein n=1 Tax=Glossina brevipalpis TaxID=37001 RepID=A0A1A9WCX2_9MUSC